LEGQCRKIKANGERCRGAVTGPNGYCWAHDPAYAKQRQKAASKAGKGKARKVTKGLHDLLEDLTQQVINGELETSRGAVANQLITTRIKLFEYERRVKETEELEERLLAVEAKLGERERGNTACR
jgi:hypothetical protein